MTADGQRQFEFGFRVLGPLYYDFCRKLYLYQTAFQRDAVCLFAYRGGARLLFLYRTYLDRTSRCAPVAQHLFYISRILALKGTIEIAYREAERLLLREYGRSRFGELVAGVCPEPAIELPEEVSERPVNAKSIWEMTHGTSGWARVVQDCMRTQRELLAQHLYGLLDGHRHVLLVDTGWSGTSQLLLMKGFPDLDWQGLYFGKWDTWGENPAHFHRIIGIGVEGNEYVRRRPETAILHYHHIIEGPLEPRFPSVEHLVKDSTGGVRPLGAIENARIPPQEDEHHFAGICRYVEEAGGQSIAEASERVVRARRILRKRILYPRRADVKAMVMEPRSVDFGKRRAVPVLHESSGKRRYLWPWQQLPAIKRSIWRQGKIAECFGWAAPVVQWVYNNQGIARRVIPKKGLRLIRAFIRHA